MPIEEQDQITVASLTEKDVHGRRWRWRAYLYSLWNKPSPDLTRPFPSVHWPLTVPALLCTTIIVLLFTRVVDLGVLPLMFTIAFDLNIAVTLLLVMAGGFLIAPLVLKRSQELRSGKTISSMLILVLVSLFFLLKFFAVPFGPNLGVFIYTPKMISLNVLAGLLLMGLLVLLAFRGSKLSLWVLVGMVIWWGFTIQGFSLMTFVDLFTSENGGRLVRSLMPPRWSYFGEPVIVQLMVTVQTAVSATAIGIAGALPLSILAARNTTPHPMIYNIVRLFINAVRAVPALILALLFIPFVGLGPVAGVFGLALHSVSVLAKLYAEAFESIKPQPLEALSAVGANELKTFRWGVFPQAFPLMASYSIYSWESNGRDSTVVAFVGGGGIGFLLQSNLSLLDYANVSVLLIVLVITVMLLDRLSDFIRSKII